MNDELYQHEVALQLAKEYGREITPEDLYESEITYLLKAVESDKINPDHHPPPIWVKSFFMFLRDTGKYPEMLESPRRFAREIIGELFR